MRQLNRSIRLDCGRTFQWEMRYELSGKEYSEPGSDTLAINKTK